MIADRDNGAVPDPLLRQAGAKGIDGRRAGKAHVYNRTTFKINAIEEPVMSNNGGHPSRQEQTRQGKKVLGLAHPIQINLFEKFMLTLTR